MSETEEEKVTQEEVFKYLVELRDGGDINMFGAAPFLEAEFGFTKGEAREWLFQWMKSFSKGEDE